MPASFHTRVSAMFRFMCVVGLVVMSLSALRSIDLGASLQWMLWVYPPAALVSAPALWFAAWLLVRAVPIQVTADGVRGPNAFGIPMTIEWSDLRECEVRVRLRLAGIRYLVIAGNGRFWRLWICVPLDDPHGFLSAVSAAGGPSERLARHLGSDVRELDANRHH